MKKHSQEIQNQKIYSFLYFAHKSHKDYLQTNENNYKVVINRKMTHCCNKPENQEACAE